MADIGKRLPDLPDMAAEGIGITDGLAFWSEMMNSPDRSPQYWWDEMKRRAVILARSRDPVLH